MTCLSIYPLFFRVFISSCFRGCFFRFLVLGILGILVHFSHYLSEAHSHSAAATPHTALKKRTKAGVNVPKSSPNMPLFR